MSKESLLENIIMDTMVDYISERVVEKLIQKSKKGLLLFTGATLGYNDAIKSYYKVEFLDEKSTRAWRPLAWCLLLSGDYDQSRAYYDRILNDNPSMEFNIDYIELCPTHLLKEYK